MKTPSLLALLLLAASIPSRAGIVAPARCDVEFLEKVAKDYTGPGSIPDPRIGSASRTVERRTVTEGVLSVADANLCDAGTRRHLATGSPLVWRNAKVKEIWEGGDAKVHAGLLLVVVDAHKAIDPKVAEVLDAANKVLAAGIAIGVAAPVDPVPAQVDFLKANSGGDLLASVVAPGDAPIKTATGLKIIPAADQKGGTVTPQSVGPTWRSVLDDAGSRSGGSEVLRFRMAVMALAAEIGRVGQSSSNVIKRTGAAIVGVKDFTLGLPAGFVAPAAAKADALDDKKYDSALALLIGPGATPALNDAATRANSLLEPVDIGARNLVAIRAAQVEDVIKAAKARLEKEKTTIVEIETKARAQTVAGTKPENKLGADVLRHLSGTDEYQNLNRLYENSLANTSEAGKAKTAQILEERNKFEAAALSARVETDAQGNKVVMYTQNGRPVTLRHIVPDTLENEATRGNAAAVIARFIVDGAKSDAKYTALLAAVQGDGQPGGNLAENRNQREREVANMVPPAVKSVKDKSAGCEKPADIIDNDHEIYAARQRAAAAEVTTDDIRARTNITVALDKELKANKVQCDSEETAANAIQAKDDFESAASLKGRRDEAAAKAKADCESRRVVIQTRADNARAERTRIEGTRSEATLLEVANKELIASFKVSVHASADKLRAEYLDPKSKRHEQLLGDAKLSAKSSPRAIGFAEFWFNQNWSGGQLAASIDSCAKALGLGESIAGKDDPSYKNPEKPNVVDEHCGVRKGVSDYVISQKGKID